MKALAGLFRRRSLFADLAGLQDFLDRNAAFLVQKCLYEYVRGRAGPLSSDLLQESAFKLAIDTARWRAYPIGLGLVAEMAEGRLRRLAGEDALPMLLALTDASIETLDRYPCPDCLPAEEWSAAHEVLRARLARLQLAPPKPVKDIPTEDARTIFDLIPIHRRLRANDLPMVTNHLRVTLCGMAGTFASEADEAAVAAALVARGRPLLAP